MIVKNAFRILTFCSLLAVCSAAEIPQLVNDLSSDNYQARTDARQELQMLMAEASKPGADATQRAGLEEQLLAQLSTASDPSVQRWIIRMLEWFGSEHCAAGLAPYLNNPNAEIQDAARKALAAIPSEAAAKMLNDALKAAPAEGKRALIDAFVYRGDARAADSILSLLESDDPAVVSEAATALGKLGKNRFLEPLSAARSRAPTSIKPIIESAMLTIGIEPGLAKKLVKTGNATSTRAGAFSQLAAQDAGGAVDILTEVLADDTMTGRAAMLRMALESRQPELSAYVVNLLPTASPFDQQVILTALADFEMSEHEKAVLALLPTATGPVRNAAFSTLGIIGGDESVQPLIDAYQASPGDAERQVLARLQAPSLDARLFADFAAATEVEKRLATMKLLAFRNPEGTVSLFNQLAESEQDETLLKAVYKTLESIGNMDSCKILAADVVEQGALKKSAQQGLKKLSLNLGAPSLLWTAVYQPAIQTAPNDQAREDMLAILDGVACTESLGYLDGLISDPTSPLRPAALRSLSRWPDFAAGEVWIKLAGGKEVSPDELKAAQNSLIRIITQKSVSANHKQKNALAVKAIQQGPHPDYKEAILSRCEVPKNRQQKKHFEQAFSKLLDDPDVGLKVYALLGKTPPPPPASAKNQDGWESLLGASLDEHWSTEGGWVLQEGGVIHLPTQEYQHWRHYQNYLVLKDRMMADFELEFEWQTDQNSGIYFHIPDLTKVGDRRHVEVQIFDNNKLDPSKPLNDHAAGGIIPHHAPTKNTIRPAGEWNAFNIRCVDNQVTVKLNGEVVNQVNLNEGKAGERSKFGGFAFQDHGYAVSLRNIRLKNLDGVKKQASEWKSLLDQELSAWEVWTGSPHKSVQNLPEGTAVSKDGISGAAMGLGDPMKLYTVSKDADGATILNISGEVYGGITTRESFSNYHLTMQFKWGEKKWEPRLDKKRDSGLLYHCYGEHGAFWSVWKRCLEVQIQEGDFGDLHCIGDTASTVPVNDAGAWDPKSSVTAKRGTRSVDMESPHGEWTRIDLYVIGDSAIHVVNGKVVLALRDAKTHDGKTLDAGQLQIQSEAAVCFAKDMRIRPITEFPEAIRTAAGL